MKMIPYLRFLITCLLVSNFISLLRIPTGDGIIEEAFTTQNMIAGLLVLTFITYLLFQGINELKGSYLTAKWLRFYAILFELIFLVTIVVAFILNDYYSPTILFIWLSSFITLTFLLVEDVKWAIRLGKN